MEDDYAELGGEQLLADIKVVVADAQALVKATANQGGEKLAEIRARAEQSLELIKDRVGEAQAALQARTHAAGRAADVHVRENPWQAVGVAAGVGVVIGWLIGRR